MTGYGKGEAIGDNFTLVVEIKTVNHRFKDYRFKMPSMFNEREISLKKTLDQNFSRGSFDIFVSYKKDLTKVEQVEIDYDKVADFVTKMKAVSEKTGAQLNIQPTEFLKSDFSKENTEKEEELLELLAPAFNQAVEMLGQSRIEEGNKLVQKLTEHQDVYTSYFKKVTELKESYQDKVREKLLKRFEKYSPELNIDEPRFLQEVIYYLEKLDIEEEITRINVHLEKLAKTLSGQGDIGRQIEFLLQELNRETNTIGSKSNHNDISENVVQMKVQLEKIREQALNLQ